MIRESRHFNETPVEQAQRTAGSGGFMLLLAALSAVTFIATYSVW